MNLISFQDLKQMGVPYSTQHLNRLIKAGDFPKPIKFGSTRNSRRAWLKTDIDTWLQQRIQMRDGGAE